MFVCGGRRDMCESNAPSVCWFLPLVSASSGKNNHQISIYVSVFGHTLWRSNRNFCVWHVHVQSNLGKCFAQTNFLASNCDLAPPSRIACSKAALNRDQSIACFAPCWIKKGSPPSKVPVCLIYNFASNLTYESATPKECRRIILKGCILIDTTEMTVKYFEMTMKGWVRKRGHMVNG